jgi:hypothetical protein
MSWQQCKCQIGYYTTLPNIVKSARMRLRHEQTMIMVSLLADAASTTALLAPQNSSLSFAAMCAILASVAQAAADAIGTTQSHTLKASHRDREDQAE